MKTFIALNYRKIKYFYANYERWLMPATLVVGFLVDYFTFVNIKIHITFTVLIMYWFLSGLIIIFMNVYATGNLPLFLKYPKRGGVNMKKRKVMIVDDEEYFLKIIKINLEKTGKY